jgi:phosphonate transport system permease protein
MNNTAASDTYRLPPPLLSARCTACWITAGLMILVLLSFWSLDLQWRAFFSADALASMSKFVREFFPPDFSAAFLGKVLVGSAETLAMSALGTLLAAIAGLALAVPAARTHEGDKATAKAPTRLLLNAMRSIPELVWASMLLITAGLGPFAGTLALTFHTTGVLGRLFAENIENTESGPAFALRMQGASEAKIFFYATLPQVLPQIISYTLYRWENNIRAAAVLGVVGAGGLGQLLAYHMGLFHMNKTCTVLIAMLLLVALVDVLSYFTRQIMSR